MADTTHRRNTKDRSVQFRIDEDQLRALEDAARREGDSLANWCRRHLLKLADWHYSSNEQNGA